MSSLAGRKNVLTLALLALGIATVSTMLVPHVAFAGGDENNCDDDDPASYSGHVGIYSVSDDHDDNNCDEDDP